MQAPISVFGDCFAVIGSTSISSIKSCLPTCPRDYRWKRLRHSGKERRDEEVFHDDQEVMCLLQEREDEGKYACKSYQEIREDNLVFPYLYHA